MSQRPYCESERLAALYRYNILDTGADKAFDELTELTAVLFDAPIAVVNFIDRDRQWFKSEVGLGVRELPLAASFCVHALLQEDLMIVPNALEDERFANNPLVTGDPKLRFYAGALLRSQDGLPLGTLCVLDFETREFDTSQQKTLRVLANQVMAQLEQRRLLQESEATRQQLENANAQLLERDRSKDRVLAMISHELRNPLSTILLTLDVLERAGSLKPGVGSGLGTIRRQTQHLTKLVDDLLDVSRIASGKIFLECKALALSEVLERSIEMVRAGVERKQHNLTVELPDPAVQIHADEVRICQLFSNLLSNAIRYTEERGNIKIETHLPEGFDSVDVVITDDGAGIDKAYLGSIFDAFVQAPQTNSGGGGLGIGLHLCKHIARLHGGVLSAYSAGPGCGSQFKVTLPLAPERRP